MNFVHIIGHIGKDAETRVTPGGLKVTNFSVATNVRAGGKDETIWWRVTVWGDMIDKMIPYLKKGKPIMVGGQMRKGPETYVDSGGATRVSNLELTASYVNFVPIGRTDAETGESQGGAGSAGESQAGGHESSAFGAGQNAGNDHDEEPLPF